MNGHDELPRFGPWQAEEKLGQGGMCVVYCARHVDAPQRQCAIKVLLDETDEGVRRFAAEAALLLQIRHPNVVEVHELHDATRPVWIAMELLSGQDLDEEMHERPLAPEWVAAVVADLASGLSAVHALGVRHRDVKPANVMLSVAGVPKLIDFGIARRVTETHRTATGMVVGTAAYMPPEIYLRSNPRGAQDTEAADVYGLGQTLCELLAGRPVYDRDGDTSLLVQIMRDKIERASLDPREWKPTIPGDLAQIVMSATAQDVADRIQSAAELEQRLRSWLHRRRQAHAAPLSAVTAGSLPPPPTTEMPAPAPPPRRGLALLTAGGGLMGATLLAAVTVLGLVVLWVLRPQGPSAPDPAEIRTALVSQAAALGPCAPGFGLADAWFGGEVDVAFTTSEGRAVNARVDRTTVPDEAFTDCVVRALEGMRFPAGPSRSVKVPLRFE